jgi:general stress protein YciG
MATEDRGFASMDRDRQREIASKGGRAAHKKGAAHQWTREEAQAAGRKGGLARHRKLQAAPSEPIVASPLPQAASPALIDDPILPAVSTPLVDDQFPQQ